MRDKSIIFMLLLVLLLTLVTITLIDTKTVNDKIEVEK